MTAGAIAIANAADNTSHEEIEEIRNISKALGLAHQEFIDAKLTIPREEVRAGPPVVGAGRSVLNSQR